MHFTVLVVGQDIDSKMAPYQENNVGDCPEKYLSISEELSYEDASGEFNSLSDIEKSKYENMETYINAIYGYVLNEDKTYFGYKENPDSQWDWYVLGGRWRGSLKLQPGKYGELNVTSVGEDNEPEYENGVDWALKGDIDWEGMKKEKVQIAITTWNAFMSKKHRIERVVSDKDLYLKYHIYPNETKKQFMKRMTDISTCAFLDSNGDWHSDIDEKEFWELLDKVPDDEYVAIVDCHI